MLQFSVPPAEGEIRNVYDSDLSNFALISVEREGNHGVNLTIGAKFSHSDRNHFSKEALGELIEELQGIREVLH